MVMKYPALQADKSLQAGIFCNAIEKTIQDTKLFDNGDVRIKAIEKVYFEKVLTIDGVAIELGYSERQIRRWLTQFVNAVGKNAGF